jgi:hypothetical protein
VFHDELVLSFDYIVASIARNATIPVDKLGGCALSSPTLPDCNIMITATEESDDDEIDYQDTTYMLYCWPADDDDWTTLEDENDGTYRILDYHYGIFGWQGTIYACTDRRAFVAIDASGSYEATIEKRDIPHPGKMRWGCQKECWVESAGDVFLLKFYTHGRFYNSEVIDMDIHRLDTTSGVYAWNKVAGIGDRTIFVGDNCVALSSATRAELRPGCVHLLYKLCCDGIRLYTIQLDDRTMTCKHLLSGSSRSTYYWVVPSSR